MTLSIFPRSQQRRNNRLKPELSDTISGLIKMKLLL